MGFRLEVKKKARRLSSDDGPCQKNNPGSDLLSHAVSPRSTIGGRELNFRVRNGNGCDPSPMTTGKRTIGAWGFRLRSLTRATADKPSRPAHRSAVRREGGIVPDYVKELSAES